MNVHQNARLTPLGRERLAAMIAGGMRTSHAAVACGICAGTAGKWSRRFWADGPAGTPRRWPFPRASASSNCRHAHPICSQRIRSWSTSTIQSSTGTSHAGRPARLDRLEKLAVPIKGQLDSLPHSVFRGPVQLAARLFCGQELVRNFAVRHVFAPDVEFKV